MVNDSWKIRWKEYMVDSYHYGSEIEFRADGSVHYKNELMPPGTVVHTWRARTNFQMQRVEPFLPLIDGEAPYEVTLRLIEEGEDDLPLMMRIKFFDRYDKEVKAIIIRERSAIFKPPIQTYSYTIELINSGNGEFIFDSLILREVSKEEFDADQQRIMENKENIKKGKKRSGKNKKSK